MQRIKLIQKWIYMCVPNLVKICPSKIQDDRHESLFFCHFNIRPRWFPAHHRDRLVPDKLISGVPSRSVRIFLIALPILWMPRYGTINSRSNVFIRDQSDMKMRYMNKTLFQGFRWDVHISLQLVLSLLHYVPRNGQKPYCFNVSPFW